MHPASFTVASAIVQAALTASSRRSARMVTLPAITIMASLLGGAHCLTSSRVAKRPESGAKGLVRSEAPVTIRVHYDFASTIAYVAHRVLEQMSDELEAIGVVLDWRPIDLVAITGWRRGEA